MECIGYKGVCTVSLKGHVFVLCFYWYACVWLCDLYWILLIRLIHPCVKWDAEKWGRTKHSPIKSEAVELRDLRGNLHNRVYCTKRFCVFVSPARPKCIQIKSFYKWQNCDRPFKQSGHCAPFNPSLSSLYAFPFLGIHFSLCVGNISRCIKVYAWQ